MLAEPTDRECRMSRRFSGRRYRRFRRWIANRAARWRLPQAPRSCEIARIARVPRQPVHNGHGCNHRIKPQAARARAVYTTSMAALWPTDDRPGFSALARLLSENSAILGAEITIDPQSLRRTLRGRRVHCATRAAPSEPEHHIRRCNRWTALTPECDVSACQRPGCPTRWLILQRSGCPDVERAPRPRCHRSDR